MDYPIPYLLQYEKELFQVQERPTVTFCNEQEVETGNEPSTTGYVSKYQHEKFILAHVYLNVTGIPIGKRGTVMVYRDHAYQNTIPTLSPLHAQNAHPRTHMTV